MAEKSKEKKIKTTPIKVVVDGNEYTIIGGDKKFRKNMRATQLEYNLDKQGYKGTPEKESNSKVNPIDNANRIRAGIKKGGRTGLKHGGAAKRGRGCEIKS